MYLHSLSGNSSYTVLEIISKVRIKLCLCVHVSVHFRSPGLGSCEKSTYPINTLGKHSHHLINEELETGIRTLKLKTCCTFLCEKCICLFSTSSFSFIRTGVMCPTFYGVQILVPYPSNFLIS